MKTIAFVALLSAAGLLAACGGPTSPGPTADLAPAAEPVDDPRPSLGETSARQVEHAYYQVFWRGLHVMTIYARPGPIRSDDPDHPRDDFSGRSAFMSVVSHYFEHEPEMGRLIDQAESLEHFLELLRADEDYELEEHVLEEGY